MPQPIPVTDLHISALAPYSQLSEVQLLRCHEPKPGLFIAETAKVIGRALDARYEPLSFLADEQKLLQPEIAGLLSRCGSVPLYTAPYALLKQLTGFPLTRGLLAVFRRKPLPQAAALCTAIPCFPSQRLIPVQNTVPASSPQNCPSTLNINNASPTQDTTQNSLSAQSAISVQGHLVSGDAMPAPNDTMHQRIAVLEHVSNPTNIGAIFRSAAALGIDALLLTPDCSDPLYRRAARVSMGTVFQIPWTFLDKTVWEEQGPGFLHSIGFRTAALALRNDTVEISDPKLHREPRLALLLGAEGEGLSSETVQKCDYTVRIPMAHGVDSLNVAAASAVAFWELCRK